MVLVVAKTLTEQTMCEALCLILFRVWQQGHVVAENFWYHHDHAHAHAFKILKCNLDSHTKSHWEKDY